MQVPSYVPLLSTAMAVSGISPNTCTRASRVTADSNVRAPDLNVIRYRARG
jgi:hypothetical protein